MILPLFFLIAKLKNYHDTVETAFEQSKEDAVYEELYTEDFIFMLHGRPTTYNRQGKQDSDHCHCCSNTVAACTDHKNAVILVSAVLVVVAA